MKFVENYLKHVTKKEHFYSDLHPYAIGAVHMTWDVGRIHCLFGGAIVYVHKAESAISEFEQSESDIFVKKSPSN